MTATGLTISGTLTLPLEAVTETFAILAKRGAGKTYCGSVMVEEMVEAGQPVVVIDPVGVWWGLRSSADGEGPGLPVVIFGGDHGDLPLPAGAGNTIADLIMDERVPAVLDLSHLSKTKSREFVRTFMERLYFRNREPLHLVVDEADLFAPQRGGADTARLIGAYEDIVRRGRARGLGCTSITQRPASLHKDILSQSEVLIVLRMTGVRDVSAINEWVQLHAEDTEARLVKTSLASMPIGEAWIWSPGWLGILQRIKVRARRTFDSSATPKPGVRVIQPRAFAPVDLERLRTRIDDDTETAPAATPAAGTAEVARLHRQITKLEHDLAEARANVRTVPALHDYDYAKLRDVMTALTEAVQPITAVLAGAQLNPAPTAPPAARRTASRPTGPAPTSPTADRGGLSRAERAILTVLAQHGTRSIVQVALLARYSHKSGGYRNALSSLRTAGYITGRGDITATAEGLAALGTWEPLPEGQALRDWWYGWLSKAESLILVELVKAWPASLAIPEIAERTGYSATSGGFRNALSRLRTLAVASGHGELRAADELGKPDRTG